MEKSYDGEEMRISKRKDRGLSEEDVYIDGGAKRVRAVEENKGFEEDANENGTGEERTEARNSMKEEPKYENLVGDLNRGDSRDQVGLMELLPATATRTSVDVPLSDNRPLATKVSSISNKNENKGVNISRSHEVPGKSSTDGTGSNAGKIGGFSADTLSKAKRALQMQKELKKIPSDPTRLEMEIRIGVSPHERREKNPETLVSVYKINNRPHRQALFKADVNAQEFKLTGCAVISEGISVVVVEGCPKSIKRYGKLMLRRIDWAAASVKKEEGAPVNKCLMVWEGKVAKPSFHRFSFQDCRTEADARKIFTDAGVANYWELAVNFTDQISYLRTEEDYRVGNSGPSQGLISYMDGTLTREYFSRKNRVNFVRDFVKSYKFASGEKICIHNRGEPIFCMSGKCLESTWVGVHGMQSICMVIRRDVDMTRLPGSYEKEYSYEENMRDFARTVISEVECLPHKDVLFYDNDFQLSCINLVKKPFGVVSVGRGTIEETGYDVSKAPHCCVSRTMDFLESRVSSELLDTHYDTLRAALRAYQLMCRRTLSADDIWVSMLNLSTGWFDHLPMDIISDQLAVVNSGCSSEKDDDAQKPLFVFRGLQ